MDQDLDDKLPPNEYYEYFGPDYRLHFTPSNMENMNTLPYIESVKNQLLENLSNLRPAPAGEFVERPPDSADPEAAGKDEEDVDMKPADGADGEADVKPARHASEPEAPAVKAEGAAPAEGEDPRLGTADAASAAQAARHERVVLARFPIPAGLRLAARGHPGQMGGARGAPGGGE